MTLPTNATVPLPGQVTEPSPFEEKRSFPRIPFRGRAQAIVFPPPSEPHAAPVRDSEVITSDLSRGGVSILYRQQLVPRQQLLLVLNDTNQMVEVCWCCRVWDGLFAAGCRFISTPGKPSAEQLLSAVDAVISDECLWWDGDDSESA
jgi:hypothetical protein